MSGCDSEPDYEVEHSLETNTSVIDDFILRALSQDTSSYRQTYKDHCARLFALSADDAKSVCVDSLNVALAQKEDLPSLISTYADKKIKEKLIAEMIQDTVFSRHRFAAAELVWYAEYVAPISGRLIRLDEAVGETVGKPFFEKAIWSSFDHLAGPVYSTRVTPGADGEDNAASNSC